MKKDDELRDKAVEWATLRPGIGAMSTYDMMAAFAKHHAAECVRDALALADAADNYCDRCGDIVQVNAIKRAIRAERERICKQLQAIKDGDWEYLGLSLQYFIDELRGDK